MKRCRVSLRRWRACSTSCVRSPTGFTPRSCPRDGLEPALTALRRSSVLPLELDLYVERPRPERVEVAAYYVVSEALSNAAKHAHASMVNVEFGINDAILQLAICRRRDRRSRPPPGVRTDRAQRLHRGARRHPPDHQPRRQRHHAADRVRARSTSGAVSPEPKRAGWSPVGEGGSECGEPVPDRWVTVFRSTFHRQPQRRASRCPAQRWRG
jgi:hypothetical protein